MAKDGRNHNVTGKLFQIMNDTKGFDVGMSNPCSGKILARYQGTTFIVSVEPVFDDTPEGHKAEQESFDDIFEFSKYLLE